MKKREILGILTLIVAVMFCFISCDKWPRSGTDNYDVADTLTVAEQIDAVLNPTFSNVVEVITYRNMLQEGYLVDSIFEVLPEPTLQNVCAVILKKNAALTKESIVKEYRANRTVYDNLPTPNVSSKPDSSKVDLAATDLGPRQEKEDVISTSYSYRVDTINGQPKKIKIKKEESYVRE